MPYSEGAHSRLVASALATVSLANCYFPVIFMLYRDMHLPQADLHGKTAIVTGANSGIGYECARSLASMGARVVLACRNENKGEEAMRNIVASTGNDAVEMEILDCGSFDSVRAFLDRWEKRESKRIDILINNAGSLTSTVALTPDGLEQTYQTNHLSHVLLTTTLLNRGHMSTEARIVSVSSLAFYESDPLDALNADNSDILSKYQGKVGTSITIADMRQLYKRSKAAQAIWTMVLQRQLAKTERWKNISVHSCHPGTVKSPMYTQPGGAGSIIGREIDTIKAIVNVAGITNEQGAVVPVWLATAEEPNQPEFRGMFWDRLKWKWVWPWCLEMERQNELWDKWYKDAQVSLLT
ncbi:hypothetical protein FS749_001909 [Ceratobasidium sp. UAMH 11750]|nr:hypothetical protein FS749_001909 [Ceratobasidium sp. UAMH 11750]